MKRILLLFISGVSFSLLFAQNDTIDNNDNIDTRIEDIMQSTETDQDADFTVVTDFLQDLMRNPLNLNTASRDDLRQLPGINDILINNLFKHIAAFGELTSVFELQAVEGFSEKIVQGIQPFVTTDARPKDIDPNRLHPAAPPIRDIVKNLKYEATQRVTRVLQPQAGYATPDTNADGSLKSHYLGSPYRVYTRVRVRCSPYLSFAVVGEKDAGEQFNFSPKDKKYGYDFLSFHAAISNFGNLKSLVIGDFNIQTGQGMIFSSGLGFGRGAEVIASPKMPSKGIVPYASVNENSYRRGIAATYAVKRIYFTGFLSRTPVDASTSYQAADSLQNDEFGSEVFSSFQLGGYHRTETELAKRYNLSETSAGGRVEYKGKTLSIGSSHLFQKYSIPLNPTQNSYNQFDLSGQTNYLNGIDFDWVYQNFNFFGEFARSQSGGTGTALGMMAALSPKIDLTLHFRNYDKNFHSTHGYVFGAQPRAVQNERGFYVGLRIRPNSKWVISSYFDRFYFPWNRFQISYPSGGYQFLTQVDYTIRRGTNLIIRYRANNNEYDINTLPDGQKLDYLVPQNRHQFRIQFQSNVAKNVMIRTRAEASWYFKADESLQKGILLYQDLVFRLGMRVKLTGRYAIFSTSDYNARIYAYENDMPGAFSIIPYSGTGSRYYLMLNYRITRGLDMWLRLGTTRYFSPNNANGVNNNLYYAPYELGSGLDAIQGNSKSELKFQVRYSF